MTGLPERTADTTAGRPVETPRRLWTVALLLALTVQLIIVYSPQGVGGPQVAGLDKVVHILIFGAPALAALLGGVRRPRRRWALGILALHAPVSELIQHFALPRRSGDVLDAVADLAGIALAATVYVVWSRRQS
jgi:peptidoglycan/LPS O-acetylase OafA/YrhL